MIKERERKADIKNGMSTAKFTVPIFSGPYIHAEIIKFSRKMRFILDTIQIYLQQ